MSLTISAAQVASLIANPSSISGYSASAPIIITGAITHTQANDLNAVDATYIQATISETTAANLAAISVDNSTRASLNKFSVVVSDTTATAAELNAVSAITSVDADFSNITAIEASPSSAITTLFTASTTGLGTEDISVNDTTLNAATLNTINGYTTGDVTITATSLEGNAADLLTATANAGTGVVASGLEIPVTVTDLSLIHI